MSKIKVTIEIDKASNQRNVATSLAYAAGKVQQAFDLHDFNLQFPFYLDVAERLGGLGSKVVIELVEVKY